MYDFRDWINSNRLGETHDKSLNDLVVQSKSIFSVQVKYSTRWDHPAGDITNELWCSLIYYEITRALIQHFMPSIFLVFGETSWWNFLMLVSSQYIHLLFGLLIYPLLFYLKPPLYTLCICRNDDDKICKQFYWNRIKNKNKKIKNKHLSMF